MSYRQPVSLPGLPTGVMNLMIINVLVYITQRVVTSPFNFNEWGSLHYVFSDGFGIQQLFTSVFMHETAGFSHIIFNMFALWMFGSTLENYMGTKKFLIFYFVCAFGSNVFVELLIPLSAYLFAHSEEVIKLTSASSDQLMEVYKQIYRAYGASGAIQGLLGAYLYLFPNTEMYLFFIPIPVKVKFVIPLFILTEFFLGIQQIKGDSVGHFAHIGGAFVGFFAMYYWNKTNRKTFY